jgi:nitroimidazol reductase NimA-like FMN-containing flavoprotein (pyridoxamine 5'-phosphate oxidase superfamily)
VELPKEPDLKPTRYHELAVYDVDALRETLRSSLVANIAFIRDGQPMMLPTAFGFDDDFIYCHGSTGSLFGREISDGRDLVVSITSLDGIIYARTSYDSAVQYRSAVIRGTAEVCQGEEKLKALETITEHLMPGRWKELPAPTNKELAATLVFKIPLNRVSLKILDGGVQESETDDQNWDMWAGVVPLRVVAGEARTSEFTSSKAQIAESTLRQQERFK